MNNIYNRLNNLDFIKVNSENPVLQGTINVQGDMKFDENKKYSIGNTKNKLKNLYMDGNINGNVNFNNTPTVKNKKIAIENNLNKLTTNLSSSIIELKDSVDLQVSSINEETTMLSSSIIYLEDSTKLQINLVNSNLNFLIEGAPQTLDTFRELASVLQSNPSIILKIQSDIEDNTNEILEIENSTNNRILFNKNLI